MLNRLMEITLLKVKFPLRCKLHYFASLFFDECFLLTQATCTILFQTRANQLICSSVFSRLSLFGTKRNANTNTLT